MNGVFIMNINTFIDEILKKYLINSNECGEYKMIKEKFEAVTAFGFVKDKFIRKLMKKKMDSIN
jgi:hypothetical protein